MHALIIKHRTKTGKRDQVEKVWRKYMLPAITDNPGHVLYAYSFGTDPDVIAAFQIYESRDDADAFLHSPLYQSYLEESRDLLEHDPEVAVVTPRWIKAGGKVTDLVRIQDRTRKRAVKPPH